MFARLPIKTRLIMLGLIAIVVPLFMATLSIYKFSGFNTEVREDFRDISAGVNLLLLIEDSNVEFKTQVQEWKNILIRGSKQEEFDKYSKAFKDSGQRVQDQLRQSIEAMKTEKHPQLALAEETLKFHQELSAVYGEQITAWSVSDPESASKADAALKGKDRALTTAMNKLVQGIKTEELEHQKKQSALLEQAYSTTRNVLLAITGISTVLVLLLVGAIVLAITRQIQAMQDKLAAIRNRLDLTERLPDSGNDEISATARSINALLEEFQSVVTHMKHSAGEVSHASEGLSSSVTQLSGSVNQQNEATSSMAAAVEEMAVSVTHVADSSDSAQQTAHNSLQLAHEGEKIIVRTVENMGVMARSAQETATTVEALGQHSQEIGAVAKTIKEIADQTNLLALNAAIEAARAGEQGRGFAVVADEVRKLAERTAEATTGITRVIEIIRSGTEQAASDMRNVVELADRNASITNQAGETIQAILGDSKSVVDAASDIASALKEQSQASDQIAKQVERIASMSEENNSALGEVGAASHQMRDLSGEMLRIVERFRV